MAPDAPAAAVQPPIADGGVRAARAVALAALVALIALGLAWELWLAPTGSGTLAVKVIPLALGVAGLLRHRLYTFRWLSLLVWLYFMEGVVRATTESGPSQVCAAAEVALCLLLFAAVAAYVRRRLHVARRTAPVAAVAASR